MSESFSSNIIKIIDNYVDNFLTNLSTKYNIEKHELTTLWNESLAPGNTTPFIIPPTDAIQQPFKNIKPIKKPTVRSKSSKINFPVISTVKDEDKKDKQVEEAGCDTKVEDGCEKQVEQVKKINSTCDFEKLSKKDLILLCKEKKTKCTGTKEELIGFLNKSNGVVFTKQASISNNQPKISFSPDNKKKKIIKQDQKILKLSKNEHGNYMHNETNLIFDKTTQRVIGKQNGDKIDKINVDDIEKCKSYNFDYDIPFNLDSSKEEYLIEKKEDDDEDEIEDELIEELEEIIEEEEDDDEY
jgi:hypothetical protein